MRSFKNKKKDNYEFSAGTFWGFFFLCRVESGSRIALPRQGEMYTLHFFSICQSSFFGFSSFKFENQTISFL